MDFLKLKDGVKFRSEEFGGLIFDPNRSMILEINHGTLKILKFLRRGIAKDELLKRVRSDLYSSVEECLRALQQMNLLEGS